MRTVFYVFLLSIVLLSTTAQAEVPGRINYQGTLTDAYGVALDTTVSMTFSIYSDSIGLTSVWGEVQPVVVVSDGIFNVLLGSVNPISETIFPGAPRWLGVQVGGDPELSPLLKLASVGYAFHAAAADTAKYALGAPMAESYWSVIDSVLYTNLPWGLARGGADNMLHGTKVFSHVNLGVACTTGTSGQDNSSCTVGGGILNTAGAYCATVAGGYDNIASASLSAVSGGGENVASGTYAAVGGGYYNTVSQEGATVAGGVENTASGYYAVVSGGYNNTAAGHLSTVAGGQLNYVAGSYSSILGGEADTITVDADYSYLFGIRSKLTQDSTFAVDMPHILFGDEATGYEMPASDGSGGQIMVTDGSGQVSWSDVADDNDWVRGTPDSVLFTANKLGITKGGADNVLNGLGAFSHVNLGIACTTGTAGLNRMGCTVGGGWGNDAYESNATVAGGSNNTASAGEAAVAGGYRNTASGPQSTVGGGWTNTASGTYATVGGGYGNVASGERAVVAGGHRNVVLGDRSAILGGWADTIAVGADYCYLFGIESKLTQDSTFAVDMPHILFGDEATGYEMPAADGSSGQIMVTDGLGRVSWNDLADDNDWVRGTPDSVLFTAHKLGLARGGSNNVLNGTNVFTHVNFGIACTTGTAGLNRLGCTVGGGWGNHAYENYATVAGGLYNISYGAYAAIAGGYDNTASGTESVVGGGGNNTASGAFTTVGGGYYNVASGERAVVAGGHRNVVLGDRSAILGGSADTIAVGADYSYLFGVDSKLTRDSTFAVDMPHILFGDEATGYEMPASDGSSGQIMVTNGGGQVSWSDAAENDWVRGTPDSVLFTVNNLGLARGGANNQLQGDSAHTHVNLGAACTTGTMPGVHDTHCTISGGENNRAGGHGATVSGGRRNEAYGNDAAVGGGIYNFADGSSATVAGGYNNLASDLQATVGGGNGNVASGSYSTVSGGYGNDVSNSYAAVGGGRNNTASGYAATMGGGFYNAASGSYSTVAGGYRDTSAAAYSFTAGSLSQVDAAYVNSAAFNGQTATAMSQTRVGVISKVSGTFTIDHPLDPLNKILNHYFVESPEMVLIYRGAAILGRDGRATVSLPDYFDALNRNPMVQLTGVGTSDVFVAEKVKGTQFVIGGKPGTEVYWTVTAERKDQSAEITKILMPVEQPKEGSLAGRSLDDDFLATTMGQLQRMGQAGQFSFRTQRGRARYEEFIGALDAQESMD
jgi:hypothetical protein